MPGFFCQPMGLTFQWCRSYVCKAKFVASVKLHQGQVQDLTKKWCCTLGNDDWREKLDLHWSWLCLFKDNWTSKLAVTLLLEFLRIRRPRWDLQVLYSSIVHCSIVFVQIIYLLSSASYLENISQLVSVSLIFSSVVVGSRCVSATQIRSRCARFLSASRYSLCRLSRRPQTLI